MDTKAILEKWRNRVDRLRKGYGDNWSDVELWDALNQEIINRELVMKELSGNYILILVFIVINRMKGNKICQK